MQEFYSGPYDALPNFEEDEIQYFLQNPGSIIEVPPQQYPTVYPMLMKSHAIVPLSKLWSLELDDLDKNSEFGHLIEHIPTGLHYFVYKEEDGLGYYYKGVLDFKGSQSNPYDLVLVTQDYKRWIKSAINAPGTRIGGIPTNSEGIAYDELWPHLKDGRALSFLAQYELKDGRYIHIFRGNNLDDYDYTEMNDENEDPYACAVIEGAPIPNWIQMKAVETEKLPLIHSDVAYTLKPHNKAILPAPFWIQDDYTPGTGEYQFLIQIGDTDRLKDEMAFEWGDSGDLYIFIDPKTDRVKAIMQCS